MKQTYYFSKKLTATTEQQIYEMPKLRLFNILNYGDADVQVSFENDIDGDSIVIPIRGSLQISSEMEDIRYKSVLDTSTIYISGIKHIKS